MEIEVPERVNYIEGVLRYLLLSGDDAGKIQWHSALALIRRVVAINIFLLQDFQLVDALIWGDKWIFCHH